MTKKERIPQAYRTELETLLSSVQERMFVLRDSGREQEAVDVLSGLSWYFNGFAGALAGSFAIYAENEDIRRQLLQLHASFKAMSDKQDEQTAERIKEINGK